MMNPVKIEFERTGYDPSIDYVKGLCILFVIWTHCMTREELRLILFPFWGDAAVQIFLTIQVFHFFKRDSFQTSLMVQQLRICHCRGHGFDPWSEN